MRKSREFDNVLNECLERLLVKGETIEQCLQSFPQHADELEPLLEMVLTTKKVSDIQPRPEFRDKARYQLYSALQDMGRKRSRPFFSLGWQPRWATVVAIVLAIFLAGSSGTVAAASNSMPDAPLYPVKLATEQVRLTLAFSELGKAELYVKLADERVAEIIYLAGEGKPEKIEQTARRLDSYLTNIAALSAPQEVLGGIAMTPATREAPLTEEAPTSEEASVTEEAPPPEEAKAVEDELTTEEVPLVPNQARVGEEADVKVDRRARVKEAVANQAKNNTARLRALLETVPEPARAALRQAISSYEKALESLE